MTSLHEFKLPDIGEGVAEGEILNWLVSEGDQVREDQPLVEVMTDKVNVEIPSPKAGKISKILAKVGDVVKVGGGLVVFEVEGEGIAPVKHPELESTPPKPAEPVPQIPTTTHRNVIATPATRKLAREMRVNIETVLGTGPAGRITEDDVKKAAKMGSVETASQVASVSAKEAAAEERLPLRGIRRAVAERMLKASHVAALVTHVDEVDATELVLLRNKLNNDPARGALKLTYLPLLIKAIIPAIIEFPHINATFDDQNQEIVVKKYYNVGIATDTESGLVVPVVRDVNKKDIFQLAAEIETLSSKARDGTLSLHDVGNSTFTLTNVGSLGGLFSTPLVNYPEVAIMGIQRITKRPVVRNDGIAIRDMMYLSLSFDHRVIDGGYAARFVNRVKETLENPAMIQTGVK